MEGQNTDILENFYVIEGMDGSGTTTQLLRIEERSREEEIPVFCTCEPTESPIGQTIRKVLRGEYRMTQESIARLFSADRCDHLDNPENGIQHHLSQGRKVITDRYLFSSLVYQSIHYSLDKVLSLNNFPLPSILFFIELSPEMAKSRRKGREIEEITEDDSIQQLIYDNYNRVLALFKKSGMIIDRIDGTLGIEEIHEHIWSSITDLPKHRV